LTSLDGHMLATIGLADAELRIPGSISLEYFAGQGFRSEVVR
jgi:hypothetical protein